MIRIVSRQSYRSRPCVPFSGNATSITCAPAKSWQGNGTRVTAVTMI